MADAEINVLPEHEADLTCEKQRLLQPSRSKQRFANCGRRCFGGVAASIALAALAGLGLFSGSYTRQHAFVNQSELISAVYMQATGPPDCAAGTSERLKDLGGNIELTKCQTQCDQTPRCSDVVWAPSDKHCILFNGCKNAGGNTGWQHYITAPATLANPMIVTVPEAAKPMTITVPEGGSCEGQTFPNFGLVALGYNIYYGDPLPILPDGTTPDSISNVFMDPGLRKPLFDIKYTQAKLSGDRRHVVADGFHGTIDYGCSTGFTTKTIRDVYEYQMDQSQAVSVSARAEVGVSFPPSKAVAGTAKVEVGVQARAFAGGGGTLSAQLRDVQGQNRLRDQVMYRSQAKCSSYMAALDFAFPPDAAPEFAKQVDGLGDNSDKHYKLFDEFGTHMVVEVKMGARSGSTMFVDNSKNEDMKKTMNGLGVTLEASMGVCARVGVTKKKDTLDADIGKKGAGVVAKASVDLVSPPEKSAGSEIKRFVSRTTLSVVGPPIPKEGVEEWLAQVTKSPVPIAFEFQPICLHPYIGRNADRLARCQQHIKTYCNSYLKPKGASCNPAAERGCYSDLDCKEDFVCRGWQCVAVPKCVVTIYSGFNYGGSSLELEYVTDVKHFGGRDFDLVNGDWANKIASAKLSAGCLKAEFVDDDGSCALGKEDNMIYRSSVSQLPYDLLQDVCKIKVWARSAMDTGYIELRGMAATQSSELASGSPSRAIDGDMSNLFTQGSCTHTNVEKEPWWRVDLGKQYDITEVSVTNRGDCCFERINPFEIWLGDTKCAEGLNLASGETGRFACMGSGNSVKIVVKKTTQFSLCEVGVKGKPAARRLGAGADAGADEGLGKASASNASEASARRALRTLDGPSGAPERRLACDGSYLGNIGKAMYGYTHYSGAPASVEFAGTDPGFQHRPLWATSYSTGKVVKIEKFTTIPLRNDGQAGKDALYNEHFGSYLSEYTSAVGSQVMSAKEGKDKCAAVDECSGVTCTLDACTLRKGLELQSSPNEEMTYMKASKQPWGQYEGTYLEGYTQAVGGTEMNLADAKVKCASVDDCNGVSCAKNKCTLRKGTNLKVGPWQETTYVRPRKGMAIEPGCYARVYDGEKFDGDRWVHFEGDYGSLPYNDKASSLKVFGTKRCTVVLYGDANFGSWRATFSPGSYDLAAMTKNGGKSNDLSSLKVMQGGSRRLGSTGSDLEAARPRVVEGRRLAAADLKAPDGWKATKAEKTICDSDYQTKEIKSQYDYNAEMSSSLPGVLSFAISSESREFIEANSKYKKAMYITFAECMDYMVEIEDLANKPPPTSATFQYVVDAVESEEDYYHMIDMFGLHFPNKIVFGAKYGLTQKIEESSWKRLNDRSSSFSIKAEYTYGIPKAAKGVGIDAGVTVGVGYSEKSSTKEEESSHNFFVDRKEVSLGKRMPSGGVEAWLEDVGLEPMPIRWTLTSICEHPALAKKKATCEGYAKSYCEKHLAQREGITCGLPEKRECLWDLDCFARSVCTDDGRCEKEPECLVYVYSQPDQQGSVKVFPREGEPVYYSDAPMGKMIDLPKNQFIRSIKMTGGCEELLLLDEDACMEVYSDNQLIVNRQHNQDTKANMPYDLQDDTCKMRIKAKKRWV